MRRRIPSIHALLAFDAVARYASITRAANALHLTESAVSRQVSLLEAQLNVRLFHRVKKRLSLTRAGVSYARDVSVALDRLEKNTFDVMAGEGAGATLEIATLPTVGSLWLIPRVRDFYALHPTLQVNWSARSRRFLFRETTLDGAVCFGASTWPGACTDLLFQEELLMVAAGDLAAQHASWGIEEILQQPRLHLVTRPTAWSAWGTAAGVVEFNLLRGQRFEVQSMLIAAACAGLGLALLPRFLIEAPLRSGALQIVSDMPLKSAGAYYFAYPEEKAEEPHLQGFRAWLQTLAHTLRDAP